MDLTYLIPLSVIGLLVVICLLARKEVSIREKAHSTVQANAKDARDIRTLIAPFMQPSIILDKTGSDEASSPATTSHFGGLPPQYPGFIWPQHDGRPLGFLACIDLAALPDIFHWLPKAGHLLFFYDMEETPWGDADQVGGWAVLHTTHPINASTPKASEPANLNAESTVVHSGMSFRVAKLPPHSDEEVIAHLQLSFPESDALMDLRQDLTDSPHQIGGFPDPIQNHDMPIECETARILLNHPNAEKLPAPAPDDVKQWQLLFQMASDDDLGVMWGDAGMLYFYVREDDAKRGDFSKVWMIMECC